MSRRQHTWLRVGAVAIIVGLQLLPRGPHGGSSTVTVVAVMNAGASGAAHEARLRAAGPSAPPSTELAIAEP